MCIGIIVISLDYSCGALANIVLMGIVVLYGLSFLPIREIYKYTGWRDACVVSGIVNAGSVILVPMILLYIKMIMIELHI